MQDEPLMAEMLRTLEVDQQYVRGFRAEQEAEIAQVRSVGRKAARRLGRKVRTFQSEPGMRADQLVIVGVVIINPDPEDEERLRERSELLFRNIEW